MEHKANNISQQELQQHTYKSQRSEQIRTLASVLPAKQSEENEMRWKKEAQRRETRLDLSLQNKLRNECLYLKQTRPRRAVMSPDDKFAETGGGVASARARKLALAADTFGGRVMTNTCPRQNNPRR